jgi:hypothetical protein
MYAMLEPTIVEPFTGLRFNDRFIALLAKIRLGWKGIELANALA